jgi:uncharacterized protein YoxC
MTWVKRNLIFVIIAIVAVALLILTVIYDLKSWKHNATALQTLNETYSTLQRLNNEKPSPGNDKINNIEAARNQQQEVNQWIDRMNQHFQSIDPIPNPTNGVVTDAGFASARDHTLNQLQVEADKASVLLPPDYSFSFQAERTLVRFAPGSLQPLATQLGEVKQICEVLYAAKINSLDDLRRVRVSADDTGGPQSDYLDELSVTNNQAIFTPYQVTFRCFSQDLAEVLTQFASSPDGFIVKGINVQPAQSVEAPSAAPMGMMEGRPNPYQPNPYSPERYAPPAMQPTEPLRRGGLQTVLNEQLLSITLEVELVKLLPR